MCRWRWLPLVLAPLALGACGSPFPTEDDLGSSFEEQLQSVGGDWAGFNTAGPSGPAQTLTLNFRLAEAADGRVTGTGTMQERGAPAAVPLTITGSYRRPALALTFDGMVYEGRAVRGTFRGEYTTVGGVLDTLALAGDGFAARLAVLLQEQ